MKIKQDFVTNSSSTAFILSIKEEWNKDNFLKELGIEGTSPMNELFEQLYETVENEKEEILAYMREYDSNCNNVYAFLLNEGFSEETASLVKNLLDDGRTVYMGRLNSAGGTLAENIFCSESFLICEDDIYFNGRISGW